MASGSKQSFINRATSVHHIRDASNDLDSDVGDVEVTTYTVHIPPTPDNQPMEIAVERSASQRVEDQYASSSLFTGGYNCVTRAHLKEKVIESENTSHPQMAGVKGSPCSVPGCDSRVMTDERGLDIVPCECDYKICRDCYRDAIRTGDGICPGCKELYKEPDLNEYGGHDGRRALPLPPAAVAAALASGAGMSKMERRLSLMKSKSRSNSMTMRSQNNEFDHAQWLFETKGSYGYGNAMWPKDAENGSDDGIAGDPKVFRDKQWRPLTRKLHISAAILSPYRYTDFSVFLLC